MELSSLYHYGTVSLAIFFGTFFIVALITKLYSIIDSCWGSGFIVVALTTWYYGKGVLWGSGFIISLMIVIWGGRLTFYLTRRLSRTGEDRRYKEFMARWKRWIPLQAFLKVFLLQGIILLVMSYPVIRVNGLGGRTFELGVFGLAGLAVFTVGLLWEAVSDYQLAQFLKNRKPGEIMCTGLWRYSRHPNYFGEILVWWGIALFAFGTSYDYVVFLSPILISVSLKWITGVPLIEKKYEQNAHYQSYKMRTRCIIPWFG